MAAAAGVYARAVKPGAEPVAPFDIHDYVGTFRITMAALDPTASSSGPALNGNVPARVTLKMIKYPADYGSDDDDDDDDDEDTLSGMLEEDDSEDEELNGGPSDPAKSPKALKLQELQRNAKANMNGMDVDGVNGPEKGNKGMARAGLLDQLESDDDDDEDQNMDAEAQEIVLCTLDPEKNYQQPLDITIPEHEIDGIVFTVTGTHTIYLTGNLLLPAETDARRMLPFGATASSESDSDEDEDDYDLPPELRDVQMGEYDDESDELDELDDPRITEVDSGDEDHKQTTTTQKPIKEIDAKLAPSEKNNKRVAEDPADEPSKETTSDSAIGSEQKLSKTQLKKQRKKMKDNAGNAIESSQDTSLQANGQQLKSTTAAAESKPDSKNERNDKNDKKVTFAKELIQGPSQNSESSKIGKAEKKDNAADQSTGGAKNGSTRVVQGITIFDKKIGTGPQAKKGDRLRLRYIGRLETDKHVFDSNTKGAPFRFKLGTGDVIKGWDIGVQGMAIGGERRITIPPHLAYGSKKTGDIPPNSTLSFEMKLLGIE